MRELEKQFGLVTKEQLHLDMFTDLRKKMTYDTTSMAKADVIKFVYLAEKYDHQLTEDEKTNIKQLRGKFGLLN